MAVNLTTIYNFSGSSGTQPSGGLCEASNGKLYGVTTFGGLNNRGVIYEYNKLNNIFSVKYNFSLTGGSLPTGRLIEDNGELFGLSKGSFSRDNESFYKFNYNTNTYTALYNFSATTGILTDGYNGYGSLLKASNGVLYGLNSLGGTNNGGTIFSANSAGNYSKLYNFSNSTGTNPYGTLIEASNGLLYGLTNTSSNGSNPVLFSFNKITKVYSTVTDLPISSFGSNSDLSELFQIGNNLYGVFSIGGIFNLGILFKYNVSTNMLTILHNFSGSTYGDGAQPLGGLVEVNNFIYGVTKLGGLYNRGTIFKIDPTTEEYTNLYSFTGTSGISPLPKLMLASDGFIYGVTNNGGLYNQGTIFRFFDTLSCEYNANINVPCSDITLVDVDVFNANCGPHSTITIEVSGGSTPYTYILSNGQGTTYSAITNSTIYSFYNLNPGNWTGSITDVSGNSITILPSPITITTSFNATVTPFTATTTLCFDLSGGTPPYTIYIDGILRISGTSGTTHCFSATCGTAHTYTIYDSNPPCQITLNQPVFVNTGFTTTTDWTFIKTTILPASTSVISGGYLTQTQTSGPYGSILGYINSQNFIFPDSNLPTAVKYYWEISAATVSNRNYANVKFKSPFKSLADYIVSTFPGLNSNTSYSGFTTQITDTTPSIFSGYNFTTEYSFTNPFGGAPGSRSVQIDSFQLNIINYTGNCICEITGTTYLGCTELILNVISYTNPSCDGAINGQITLSATGGLPTYTYFATDGVVTYSSTTGNFSGLNSGTWYLSVTDSIGVTTNLTLPITLINSFYANIISSTNGFCVTITGGTEPYFVFQGTNQLTWTSGNTTNCFTADCSTVSVITVRDSSG